jgi:hypothetical protein
MKLVRMSFIVLAAAIAVLGLGAPAYAFHSGGVAECGGCHSMHTPNPAGSYLLIGADPSGTCLSCHEQAGLLTPSSYHVSTASIDQPAGTAPRQRTQGGDFGWIRKDYSWVVRGNTTSEEGDEHGHNIVSPDFGYYVDTINATAPGGTYPATNLGCNSCHDPHGKARRRLDGTIANTGGPIIASGSYHNSPNPAANQPVGVYRLLAGPGYTTDGVSFVGVPAAVTPTPYNRAESTAATQVRVAYGVASTGGHVTWGNWCGTCHPDMHSSGNYVHPVDEGLGSGIKTVYDQYRSSGVMTGTNADAFLSLVPFIQNSADYSVLKTNANPTTVLTGPGNTDQVACMSCHRAHASGFPYILRWQMEGEFITSVLDSDGTTPTWPGTDTTPGKPQFARGRLAAENQAAYYDRPVTVFGAYQRVLCNKCHAQD